MGKSIKQVLTSVAASSLAVATNPNDAHAQVPAISAAHIALSNKPVTSTRTIPGGVVNTAPQPLNPIQTQAVYINERQVFDHTTHGINLKTITTSLLA